MAGDDDEEALVEEREAEMVAFLGSKQPINRKGWFLKPISNSSKICLFPQISSHFKKWKTPKCSFKGWVCSLKHWHQWVEKLRPIYKDLWKKVGIFEAITASTYKFGRDPSSLWGVARFWCEETNTFLFPWAEATVTLEDVMILGGFSVLGEPVRVTRPLDGELAELEAEMGREVRRFNQTKSKKADITTWMKYYTEEGNGNELEHIAFLALWLSRFVLLAPPARTIGHHVIPIAVRLARGARIALAPAVLASLYRDLRKMKDCLGINRKPDAPPLVVWAPFHILQLWIWERFLALRPESSTFVNSDDPRAARWCNVGKKLNYRFVMSVIKSQDEIQWRPYLASFDHWCKPSYFRDVGDWVFNNEVADEGLESFVRCLRACELVGLDCVEQYLPHRVARQFGLDQDIPSIVPRSSSSREVAWGTLDICAKNLKFYVPSRHFESDVTLQYSIWWDSVKRLLRKKKKGNKRKKIRSLQCCTEKEHQDRDDITLSDWLASKNGWASSKHGCENPHKPSIIVVDNQNNHSCIKNTKICREHLESPQTMLQDDDEKLPLESLETMIQEADEELPVESSETMKQDVDDLKNVDVGNGAVTSNSLDMEDKGAVGYIEATSAGESVYDPIVTKERDVNFKTEEVEESSADRTSEVELDIEKLKEAIALIHARVKNLESLAEVHH